MTSQTREQIITIQILAEISRSKDNQKMKFVQFMECNMRKIFIEKLYTNVMEKLFPDAFLKKSKFSISLDEQSENLTHFSPVSHFYTP